MSTITVTVDLDATRRELRRALDQIAPRKGQKRSNCATLLVAGFLTTLGEQIPQGWAVLCQIGRADDLLENIEGYTNTPSAKLTRETRPTRRLKTMEETMSTPSAQPISSGVAQGSAAPTYTTEELVMRAIRNATPHAAGPAERWVAIMHTFGVGSTVALNICREYGLDPTEDVPGARCYDCTNTKTETYNEI